MKKMKKDKQLEWINIIELFGKPIWDNTHKKWRVLDGYKEEFEFGKFISFTDFNRYIQFEEYELYREEQKDE